MELLGELLDGFGRFIVMNNLEDLKVSIYPEFPTALEAIKYIESLDISTLNIFSALMIYHNSLLNQLIQDESND